MPLKLTTLFGFSIETLKGIIQSALLILPLNYESSPIDTPKRSTPDIISPAPTSTKKDNLN